MTREEKAYCAVFCKGFQDTGGKCFVDGRCQAYKDFFKSKDIKEEYVSFEIAKLMKEQGFTAMVSAYYNKSGVFRHLIKYIWANNDLDDEMFAAPTQQMAMQWIRRHLCIAIEPYRAACGWDCTFSKIPSGTHITSLLDEKIKSDNEESRYWTTYESACEAAIIFCLKSKKIC